MKLLYVSCLHPLLESDHCYTWSDLEIEYYSTGYYGVKNGLGELPKLKNYYANADFRKKLKENGKSENLDPILKKRYITFTTKLLYHNWKFKKDFLDPFNVIIFNYDATNIINNLDVLKDKTVILITFGMNSASQEPKIGALRALKRIVRISNNKFEKLNTVLYGGEDAIINGSVVPGEDVINNWTGKKCQVCTFTNGFNWGKRREYYVDVMGRCPQYDFLLYGANNENEPLSGGFLSTEKKFKIMRESRVHFVTGTPGSSCTYSLGESMIMGAPTVCYGQTMWQSPIYEVDKIFNHGEEILIGQTPEECADYIQLLMADKELCKYLGRNARRKAISIYGRKVVAEKWRKLFTSLGFNI